MKVSLRISLSIRHCESRQLVIAREARPKQSVGYFDDTPPRQNVLLCETPPAHHFKKSITEAICMLIYLFMRLPRSSLLPSSQQALPMTAKLAIITGMAVTAGPAFTV